MPVSMIGNPQEIVQWLFNQPKDKIYEIRERKNKRSLTQNAYYWELEKQLAAALRVQNNEMHFMLLRKYGVFEVISVLSSISLDGYFKYFEKIGKGHVDGKEFTHYKIYKGSSQMDSKEFSRLLDGTIEECEQVGIPTMTPDEIEKLKFIGGQ